MTLQRFARIKSFVTDALFRHQRRDYVVAHPTRGRSGWHLYSLWLIENAEMYIIVIHISILKEILVKKDGKTESI